MPDIPVAPRRVAVLCVTLDWLGQAMKGGPAYVLQTTEHALPDDARVVAVRAETWIRPELHLLVESESFEPVGEWDDPPNLPPTVTRVVRQRTHSTLVVEALSLMDAMVSSGERHSEESRAIVDEAKVLAYAADLVSPVAAETSTAEPLAEQVDRLARFILEEVPGEPSESQGAIDTAIRIIRNLQHMRSAVVDHSEALP